MSPKLERVGVRWGAVDYTEAEFVVRTRTAGLRTTRRLLGHVSSGVGRGVTRRRRHTSHSQLADTPSRCSLRYPVLISRGFSGGMRVSEIIHRLSVRGRTKYSHKVVGILWDCQFRHSSHERLMGKGENARSRILCYQSNYHAGFVVSLLAAKQHRARHYAPIEIEEKRQQIKPNFEERLLFVCVQSPEYFGGIVHVVFVHYSGE
jgi:hypothetical protein